MIEDCRFYLIQTWQMKKPSTLKERSCSVPQKCLYILCVWTIGPCNSSLYDNFLLLALVGQTNFDVAINPSFLYSK